jgi:hypothetical protein
MTSESEINQRIDTFLANVKEICNNIIADKASTGASPERMSTCKATMARFYQEACDMAEVWRQRGWIDAPCGAVEGES